jgi:hypothetical protein
VEGEVGQPIWQPLIRPADRIGIKIKYRYKGIINISEHHESGSTLRRFGSGWESLSALDSPSADRFSWVAAVVGAAAAFGFFFTMTPFNDFLMSFFAGTVLPCVLSEGAFVGLGVDEIIGGGLLVAFSRAATALEYNISEPPLNE